LCLSFFPFFIIIIIINTLVSLPIPGLQLRLTTSSFSNLDSTLKANTQYLSIEQCRVLVLICSHVLPRTLLSCANSTSTML
jgi:ABC-type microcin C transport system permease subunit YejE